MSLPCYFRNSAPYFVIFFFLICPKHLDLCTDFILLFIYCVCEFTFMRYMRVFVCISVGTCVCADMHALMCVETLG